MPTPEPTTTALISALKNLVERHAAATSGALPITNFKTTRINEATSEVFRVAASVGNIDCCWIAKHGSREEIFALELLRNAGIDHVPELLARSNDADVHLLLIPEYPGTHSDFGDPLPPCILRCLARIHAHFNQTTLPLRATDEKALQSLFRYAFEDLGIYPTLSARVKLARVRDMVKNFVAVARRFPQTLVHWDVHPGNIIVNGNNSVLIDWGLARRGPAMIDLANVVPWDSPDFHTYVGAWESFSGEQFDDNARSAEYTWSRAITQIKYLPVPARAGAVDAVERMAEIALEYAVGIAGSNVARGRP